MSTKSIELNIENDIAHIIMNQPDKRNAMGADFWAELPQTIRDIDENVRARVIVISSTGPHFSAGIDITMLAEGVVGGNDKNHATYPAAFLAKLQYLQDAFNAIENCRLPVLAAVQGGCYGAGVDMITSCDMRYATKDAFFTIYEIKVGMTADVGTFPRICNLIPEGVVRELAYTGRKMHAGEAEKHGLVNTVYEDHTAMLKGVMEIATEIAANPPISVYGCKQAITYARDHSTSDALAQIGLWNASFLNPPEMMEAIGAKAQKRAGQFEDLPKIKGRVF